jgi:Kef-type K+ transport system membrane component KefB
MSISRLRKEKQQKVLKITAASIVVFGIGCYMLFVISRSFRPMFGNTFHILVGCIMIAVSSLVLLVTLKNYFFPKKRKKRSNVVFLEDELRKQKKQQQQQP